MGQTEGMQLVSSRAEGHMSPPQAVQSKGRPEKQAMPEQQLHVTSSVQSKRCFACHDTSHDLEQCGTKHRRAVAAHQFGYATKNPFAMI
jgi:translation initiation factor 4A